MCYAYRSETSIANSGRVEKRVPWQPKFITYLKMNNLGQSLEEFLPFEPELVIMFYEIRLIKEVWF